MAIFHVDVPNHPKVTTRRALKGGVPVGNPRTTWRFFEYIWENHRNVWENIKQAPKKTVIKWEFCRKIIEVNGGFVVARFDYWASPFYLLIN
jgi:hypothetical protein